MTWANGHELTKAEAKEVQRLSTRHADIRIHGNEGFAEREAAKLERKLTMLAFVAEHNIGCFKCGSKLGEWAKAGTNEWGKPWAICIPCVRRPR